MPPLWLHPQLQGHWVTVVIYVRNQSDYLESLYIELVEQGIVEELRRFAAPLFRERCLRLRDWTFQFDYAALHDAWRRCPDAELVVRNYHALDGGSVIADFMAIVCADFGPMTRGLGLRANTRAPLAETLTQFYTARIRRERELQQREAAALAAICEKLGDRKIGRSAPFRARVDAEFATSNRRLCAAAGLPRGGILSSPPPIGDTAAMERLFSFELHNLIADCPEDPWTSTDYMKRVSEFVDQL